MYSRMDGTTMDSPMPTDSSKRPTVESMVDLVKMERTTSKVSRTTSKVHVSKPPIIVSKTDSFNALTRSKSPLTRSKSPRPLSGSILMTAVFLVIIAFLPSVSGRFSCPVECACSPEQQPQSEEKVDLTMETLIKITCSWPHIPGANLFSTFPHRTVYSLIIDCKTSFPRSRYVAGMFSSFTALRHLTIRNCHSEDNALPNGLLQGLTKLKTLHLDGVSMQGMRINVNFGALVGAPYLERLTLSRSMLSEIPGDTMCHFKQLKMLNLSHNEITDLKSIGYYAGGGSNECENHLITLDLSHNRLKRLDQSALKKMNSLQILRLEMNGISILEKGTFLGLHRLQELYLNHNDLTRIDDLPGSIQILDVADNKLVSIPGSIRHHQNLIHLNVSGNQLDPNSPFHLADQISILDISRNRLRRISASSFTNASGLQQLYLSNNELEELEGGTFKTMPRLRYLDLSKNRLRLWRNNHLSGLQNLSDLNLDDNRVSSITDDAFTSTPQLRHLSMKSNSISQPPTALTSLYYLQRLDLSSNRISSIPKFLFDKLPNLRELRLQSNQIRSLDRYVLEKIPGLIQLDLSYNRIDQLATNCFDGTTSVKLLRLDGNSIRDIQGTLLGLHQLQSLNLSSNRIGYIDFAMLPVSLRSLYAANNSITHIGDVLRQQRRPSQLLILDLAHNKIKQLNADAVPNSIQLANFSGNNIARIDDQAMREKMNLSFLDLTSNWLEELPLEAVKVGKTGEGMQVKMKIEEGRTRIEEGRTRTEERRPKIALFGNPLRCTCHNEWIRRDRLGTDRLSIPEVIDRHRLTCTVPRSTINDPPLMDVGPDQFLCDYEILCSEGCKCCDFDSCDCKSVCPEGCSCYHDSAFTSNLVQCDARFQATLMNMKRKIPMHATEIDLSRSTKIDQLHSNSFFARFKLKRLFLNNTNIGSLAVNAFNGLIALETMDLSHNRLEEIRGDEFNNTPKLYRLLLNDNHLRSISQGVFERLSGLKELTLHNNRFHTLPTSIVTYSPVLASLTMSGNPWKCDCDPNRYVFQRWLPENTILVSDHRIVYCADSLISDGRITSSSNSTTNATSALSSLPVLSIGQTVIKVNFWTFVNGINVTFCRSTTGHGGKSPAGDGDQSSSLSNSATGNSTTIPNMDLDDGQNTLTIMFICVAVGALVLILVITVIIWRCQTFFRCKYSKYSTASGAGASSINSSTRTTATTPIPLIQFDAFVSYSAVEEGFVTGEITNRLEQEYPYYNLCLLYRDLPTSPCMERHRIDDKIISNMERSQRVVTVLTRNFLDQEWKSTQLRTAYQYLMREKQRKPIIVVVVVDELPDEIDPTLAHYLRINRCLYWKDPMFWQKFMEAMPERSVQQESTTLSNSSHYSDVYGAIVPSRFV